MGGARYLDAIFIHCLSSRVSSCIAIHFSSDTNILSPEKKPEAVVTIVVDVVVDVGHIFSYLVSILNSSHKAQLDRISMQPLIGGHPTLFFLSFFQSRSNGNLLTQNLVLNYLLTSICDLNYLTFLR